MKNCSKKQLASRAGKRTPARSILRWRNLCVCRGCVACRKWLDLVSGKGIYPKCVTIARAATPNGSAVDPGRHLSLDRMVPARKPPAVLGLGTAGTSHVRACRPGTPAGHSQRKCQVEDTRHPARAAIVGRSARTSHLRTRRGHLPNRTAQRHHGSLVYRLPHRGDRNREFRFHLAL